MRIATWNVNSLKARLERVLEWARVRQPDVLCLQETKIDDASVPAEAFRELGYQVAHHGLGSWNGVAIASRVGLEGVTAGMGPTPDGWSDDGGRFVAASCAGVRVVSVYVPNGRMVGSETFEAKLIWLDRLVGWIAAECDPASDAALCGDFNVAPEDTDVWDPDSAHGGTHVSPPERERIRRLREWGMVDVVRRFHPEPGYFTWWDYRAGHFHKNIGMRIDHVYASASLAARATAAERDRDARKPSKFPGVPSDHAPVIVDFAER
jgi:exodeoxyribonuclease-3